MSTPIRLHPDPTRPGAWPHPDDVAALAALLDDLIWLRRASGLTQTQVGQLMAVRQPTVSALELRRSRQQFETVQRYARAIGARVNFGLELVPGARNIRP